MKRCKHCRRWTRLGRGFAADAASELRPLVEVCGLYMTQFSRGWPFDELGAYRSKWTEGQALVNDYHALAHGERNDVGPLLGRFREWTPWALEIARRWAEVERLTNTDEQTRQVQALRRARDDRP